MRLFAAVALTSTIRSKIETLSQTHTLKARWEHPNDYHITLRFIGDADDPTAARYADALRTVQAVPFSLSLSRVGRFPDDETRLPKVLWVGVDPSPDLMALQRAVSDVLDAQGLPKDKFAGYTPHITIARFNGDEPLSDVSAFVEDHTADAFTADPHSVTEFVLYQSLRHSSGGNYQVVERFELKE